MNRLEDLPNKDKLVEWLVNRQIAGFQGRINKVPDTCYSFWIGATLSMLGAQDLIDFKMLRSHTFTCQKKIGGFSKHPDQHPDVLHTYMSLCGLNLLGNEPGIQKVDPALGFNAKFAKKN